MAYRILLTPRASSDADEAATYIKQFSPGAASRWLQGLMQAVFSLAELPERCPLAPEAELLGAELRQLLYGKRSGVYRILFRIESGPSPVVRILAVRHGARQPV
jgi:plasmid stabilization system protein ParE